MTILLDPAETGSAQPDQAVDVLATAVTRPRPGTVLLTVSGEIDTLTAPASPARMTICDPFNGIRVPAGTSLSTTRCPSTVTLIQTLRLVDTSAAAGGP